MVPAPETRKAVGGYEERLEFGPIQERDERALATLGWYCEHPLNEGGMFRVDVRCVLEEGVDGGQSSIPGGHPVATILLEVLQEGADQVGIQILERELRGGLARPVVDEHQQHSKCVTVGGHRVWTGLALLPESLAEEGFETGRERTHGSSPSAVSSGAADRYQ